MKPNVETIQGESAKVFTISFNDSLCDMEIQYFLSALPEEEESKISCFFDTIILLEEISDRYL